MRNWRCWFGHDMTDGPGRSMPDFYVLVKPRRFVCRRCGEQQTLYPRGWGR